MNDRWKVQLLGGLCVEVAGRSVTRFRTQKAATLLAYLAYHLSRTQPRELLIDLLWPDCDVDAGRHRLSVALSSLRRELELPGVAAGTLVIADHFSVGLNPASVTTDVGEFEGALQSADRAASAAERTRFLSSAVDLYRGELLPGYYEDWIFPEQQRLRELFVQALQQLSALHEQCGALDRALPYALRAVGADPLREEAHREVMRLYAATGQPNAALRQYRELERVLQDQLGDSPSPETQQLVDQIRRPGAPAFRRPSAQDDAPSLVDCPVTVSPGHRVTPSSLHAFTPSSDLEPVGGAVPLGSPFYVERLADAELRAAIARADSVVLLKGASQVGKTSLLARGVQQSRQMGARVILTDLQKLNASHMESAETLCRALAEWIAEQLDLEVLPEEVWHPRRGPSANLERYVRREVLEKAATPVVWAVDEIDRLFEREFSRELFRLFRAWHNERALDPSGPWSRLTLAIAYATEAHLFITDLNQSPFNVGTRLTLEDFTPEQVADLNRRYGSPLQGETDLARFYGLVSGHPSLVRLGLHELATRGTGIAEVEARAADGEWIFGDALQRILAALVRDPGLCEVVRGLLQGRPCPSPESFYRLRSAGVVAGDSAQDARLRCRLYAMYLERHLP